MTVSRVLNNNPHVTEETRVRVTAAVEELQYHRNEIARSLREQTSRQIGILVPNLYDPFFATCAHAIGTVARQHGYSVVLSTSEENATTEHDEASRMLRRNVDGLVLIPAMPREDASPLLDRQFERLPIVTLDRPVEGSRFDSVLAENEQGMQLGAQHLISLGHKRIMFVGLSRPLFTMHMREQGYREAMLAAHLKPHVVLVSETVEEMRAVLQAALAATPPPTAILCANNLTTRNMLHSLYSLGIHPPEKIALVGFDDFETADLMRPGVTVVRQPTDRMGRLAGELLFHRLNGEVSASKSITFPVELVVRGSCGATPSSASAE